MIPVTDTIVLGDNEIEERFVRSVGPAGQNRNKQATAVELRMNVSQSSLPADVKQRLVAMAERHLTNDGELVVVGRDYSSQLRNREAARGRLIALIKRAASPPKPRVATEPPHDAVDRRHASKERKSALKRSRRNRRESENK